MTAFRALRWLIPFVVCIAAAGCVVAGGGGGYAYDGGLPGDYYQPYGFSYGGWGPGYEVGPYHGGGHYAGGYAGHAYRPASGGHGMPGLPAGEHGGGGHGGGGHDGGGHGGHGGGGGGHR